MAPKIVLPAQAEDIFAKLAKANFDAGGKIVELLGFLVGKDTEEGLVVSDLILPVQKGTASKVDDLGICGKDTSMWIFQDSDCSRRYKENFRIIAWAHTHVQGTPCGLSSIDCHTQYAYSKMFPNVSAVVLEVKENGTHKMDWFQLTEEGVTIVEKCCQTVNMSREQHHECSSPHMYTSNITSVEPCNIQLAVTDARNTRPLDGSLLNPSHMYEDQPLHTLAELQSKHVCKNCLKEFISSQKLLAHVARAPRCKTVYGAEYENMRKDIFLARKRDQYHKHKEKVKQRYLANKDNNLEKNSGDKDKAHKRYVANKDAILKKYQANRKREQEKYQANKEKLKEKYQANKEKLKEKYQANKEKIQEKNKANKEKIQVKYQANKEKIWEKYQINKEKIQGKYHSHKGEKKQRYMENKGKIKEKYLSLSPAKKQKLSAGSKCYYKNHRTEILRKRKEHYANQATEISQRKIDNRRKNKNPIHDFRRSISQGPVFPCICCHRILFHSAVSEINVEQLKGKIGQDLTSSTVSFNETFFVKGRLYMCTTCLRTLKRQKKPTISSCNGLCLDVIPEALKLSELEQQLIAKRLLFMKVFKLPRSRMSGIKDKVVNVPLEDEDIMNTASILPRQASHSSLVNVRLKRMKKLKNVHNQEFVRPEAVRQALAVLKRLGNPHYQFEFSPNETENASMNIDFSDKTSSEESDEDSDAEEDDRNNMYTAATCMVHENPETLVVINKTSEIIKKQTAITEIEIAPGEGKVPTNWLKELDFDILSFPTLFPTGKYGCDHKREQKITKQRYFNQRILNIDRRFSQNMTYLFAAQQRVEREQIEQQFNLVVQKGKVTEGMDGKTIMSTTDNFAAFKRIRGTPKYFQQVRNELIAKIGQLGPFHLFFTLSSGEKRWDEIIAALLELEGRNVKYCSVDTDNTLLSFTVDDLPLDEFLTENQLTKQQMLQDNIMVVTRMFDHRVKKFIQHIVMSSKSNMKIKYYSYRVEFQMRGMAHIHGVMWLEKDVIESVKIEGTNEYDEGKLCLLIDSLITCERPSDKFLKKIVDEVQTHHHTKSCKKYGDSCRFGYPRLPSKETLISKPLPLEMDKKERKKKIHDLKNILEKIKQELEREDIDEETTLDDLLRKLNIPYKTYKEALQTSERGSTVVLKRTVKERYVNNYNPLFLEAWNANLDIQFCHDSYAVITYICDYYGKDDSGMTKMLREALQTAKGKGKKDQLYALKSAYLTHRQIGACEATYRLLPNLHMKDSNIACNFLSTGFPENRSVFLKRVEQDTENTDDEDKFQLEEQEGKFEKTVTMHDRYRARPKVLEQLCLAQFAIAYKQVPKERKKVTFVNESTIETGNMTIFETDIEMPLQIKFKITKLGIMQLRKSPCVLRIHESKKKKQDHEYYYSELLLFFPWRNEVEDCHRHDGKKCMTKFMEKFEVISQMRKNLFPYTDTMEEAQSHLEEACLDDIRPAHIYDQLDPQGTQDNEEDEANHEKKYSCIHPGDFGTQEQDHDAPKYRSINVENEEELLLIARQLIPEQQKVFHKVISHCKKLTRAFILGTQMPSPLHIIIHGGAGSGKSNLVRALTKWAEKLLRKAGDHPNKPRILVTAPTGMAASVIGGVTIHSALNINYGDDLKPMSDKKIDEIRVNLRDLKYLIIDEMSMVRSDMLYQIHCRLCEIFQNSQVFGGISVILVGDLLQLKPVKGAYIFQPPKCHKYKMFHETSPLWEGFQVCTLEHNHRQGKASKWAEILNRLRCGIVDLDQDHLKKMWMTEEDAKQKENACHIFYTNKEVDNYNCKMLNKLDSILVSVSAVVSVPFGCKSKTNDEGRIDNTGFMKVLQFKVGAKVMLIYNVDVIDNMSNGAMGCITGYKQNKEGNVVCILVQFDNQNVGEEQRRRHSRDVTPGKNDTPVYRTEFSYQLPKYGKGGHTATAKILQFPLRLSWAVTAHKVQGQTFKSGSQIVVHWHRRMMEGMA